MILLLTTLLIHPVLLIWYGFVLSKLWFWFMVPTFGLPALGIPAAIGIAIIASHLTKNAENPGDENPWQSFGHYLMKRLLSPAFALLAGWIVSLFM